MSDLISGDYPALLAEVKERIRAARYAALRAVNKELIGLYWDIGRMIVERQEGDTWGKSVVERLARDLRIEFPGVSGFSTPNLWRMRRLYETYGGDQKLSPMVREIGWTHNTIILDHCHDALEREFYIRMTRKHGWTRNVLLHQIEGRAYEATLLNQTNFDQTLPDAARAQAHLAVKDDYTFDFLALADEFSERQLEAALLANVDRFLRELGGLFTLAGSQYRLEVGDHEYFIDLLLYHRRLRCLVAVELKIGEFLPEYVGKMQFYLALLDDRVRMPDETPSIGIILCKSKDRTIVEYALKESNKPIGVATYRIVSSVPDDLRGELPPPAQVARLLEGIE
ncbi:MAG TPA: PDDEXK nuclease domain-containing protein [Ktedonobacterales bacterium]